MDSVGEVSAKKRERERERDVNFADQPQKYKQSFIKVYLVFYFDFLRKDLFNIVETA